MISKTHTSAQKPRGRQLKAKVCGSESTNFRPLCSDHFSNNDNSKTAQVLTLILARNCSSQRAASQPLSVFIGSKLPWSRKLFTAQPDGCSLRRTPFPNVVRMRTRSRWPRLWDLALDHGPKCIDGLRNLVSDYVSTPCFVWMPPVRGGHFKRLSFLTFLPLKKSL